MKKIKIYSKPIAALILFSLILAGCDILSVYPENDLIKEKFWNKKEDADGALAAAYDAFRNEALNSFIWGELRADIATFSGSSFSDYRSIAASDISPSNDKINWNGYYEAINLANTLIYFMPEVMKKDESFTVRMKDAYEAEALFLRALSYFYLVRIWKEVPLEIEATVSDQGDLYLPKSSEKEVIQQIVADLLRAKDLAYTDEFKSQPVYYKGRANKYSIMALLADVYLWDEQYENSVVYCDSIINTGKFGLEGYNEWFQLYFPGNSMRESLFEIQFDDTYEKQENPIYKDLIQLGHSPSLKIQDQSLSQLMSDNDVRMCGNETPVWKYMGTDQLGVTERTTAQRDANFIYYRYADVLLIKAEALNETGKLIEANALVRDVASRAGITHLNASNKDDLRQDIMDERGREFVFEGKRWFDLLRNAKRNHFENKQIIINMILAGADVQQKAILRTRVYDTMSYYLPIPESELLYNPELVQNPYYDR